MDDGADLVCIAFMMAGGMPFGVYLLMATRGDWRAPMRDSQVRAFLVVAMMTFYLWLNSELTDSRALRLSAFNVVSIVTGTGYATADYNLWGPFAVSVVFSVMSYFFLFFMTFAVVAISLSVIGLDPITAWSGAGSAVANVGPGLGDIK